jgi:phosphoribosylformylglycinamidine synthase I
MKFGVVVFPGSNCDHDTYHAAKHVLRQDAEFIWHKDTGLKGADVVILPGGFAHGDYLRTGAIGRFSPIMPVILEFARAGGPVQRICNGYQILLEAGLLPGAMLRNRDLKCHCEQVVVRVEQTDTPFTQRAAPGQRLRLPVAHGEGNYIADSESVARLEDEGRVLFRYAAPDGSLDPRWNVNGATNSIAGILNEAGNVLGMMPHPENHVEASIGVTDGRGLFAGLAQHLQSAA